MVIRAENSRLRIVVLSPWGVGGGYSGPLTLLDRLMSAVKAQYAGAGVSDVVTDSVEMGGLEVGGREMDGVEIDVVARDRGSEITPEWVSAVHYVGGSTAPKFGLAQQLRWAVGARRFLRKTRGTYDVVHLHGAYIVNQLAVVFAGLGASTVVLPVLENGDLSSAGSPASRLVKRFISRSVMSSAGIGYALSPKIAAEMHDLGMPAGRIENLGNVVDMDRYADVAEHAAGPIRLGFVGKLGPIKRPHLLVEAIAVLIDDGMPAAGVFVGPFASKEYEEEFWATVTRLGMRQSVSVIGFVDDAAPYFQRDMDVFVLPSRSEGLPGALAEAMASGLPCLVTDVGGMARVVRDAGSGFVIKPDAAEIADAVKLLAGNRTLGRQLGAAGRSYAAEHFSSAVVARTYLRRSFHRALSDESS